MILHRPELLQISAYGVNHWPVLNLVYLHLQKNRDGELGIIIFENNLKYNRLDETSFSKLRDNDTNEEELFDLNFE